MDYSLTIWSVASFVEARVKEEINYDELEKTVGFSYRHIREVFKDTIGISLSKYILIRRISCVAFDMTHTHQTLTEIASKYMFDSYDSFTRAFKRIVGMTPTSFLQNAYPVGRRRLLMGIYGPVIFQEEDTSFFSKPILEVEENMKSIERDNRGCVLYGVPKVAYTYEECTPFPTALKACLNYMGQSMDYAYLMAATGAAFRLRWNLNYWDGGNVDIMNIYEDPYEAFKKGFQASGRSYKILKREEASKEAFIAFIKEEIDEGRPVIALGIIGPPEACIITGYRDHGETLLGWNCFQENTEFTKGVTLDPSGYFICNNWWENKETKAVMSIGEQQVEPISIKEILENGIYIMTKNEINYQGTMTCKEGNTYAGGQEAYDAWANAIANDGEFSQDIILPMLIERVMCQNDAQVMIGEGRSYAACFVTYIGKQYKELEEKCNRIAKLFRDEAQCAFDMNEPKGGFGQDEETTRVFANPEVRKKIVTLIHQAKTYDLQARQGLEEILTMM